MKFKVGTIFIAIIAAFFIFQNPVLATEVGQPIYKEGEILVKYKEPVLGNSLQTIQISPENDLNAEIEGLKRDDNIEYAEPVLMRKMTKTPDDPYYSYQWHHTQTNDADINSPKAWEKTTGKTGTVIAVIDSGVDLDHPDLSANIWTNSGETPNNGIDDDANGYVDDYYGWDFVDDDNDPNPDPDGIDNDGDGYADYGVTHGTHVAGLAAGKGNNSTGITGVCWKCKIMTIQVLSDEGWGDSAGIAEGINYAVANGADVINMSLGSYGYSTAEYNAVTNAIDQGVVVVAAVGNDTIDLDWYPNYPSCYTGVLGVSSTDSSDYASYFSNYGSCADVAAPGSYDYSTLFYNSTYGFYYYYGYMSGTSMASPVTAGLAGLMKSYDSTASVKKIRNTIIDTADSLSTLSTEYGSGRLNANKALNELKDEERPTKPKTINAYKKPNKKKKIAKNTRTTEKSPYFKWSKGTDNKSVAGYYVYWGTNKKAGPKAKGDYQTGKTLKKYKIRGNEKAYYLRIKTKDSSGNISKGTAQFKYLVDNKAKKPKSVNVTDKSSGVKVTWKCGESHVKRFNIFRRVVKDGGKTGDWKKVNTTAVTVKNFLDTSAVQWKKYQYRIQVKDTLNNTAYSKASDNIKHRL